MIGIRRTTIDWHRIQDGRAIVSFSLRDKKPLSEGGRIMSWTGDAYELRDELLQAIEILERKQAKKRIPILKPVLSQAERAALAIAELREILVEMKKDGVDEQYIDSLQRVIVMLQGQEEG